MRCTARSAARLRIVKALRGFGGRSVLEIVAPHNGDTYRAVYTVSHGSDLRAHAFQKKSKRGIATPKAEIDLIRQRRRMPNVSRTKAETRWPEASHDQYEASSGNVFADLGLPTRTRSC